MESLIYYARLTCIILIFMCKNVYLETNHTNLVVDGEQTTIQRFPHQVALCNSLQCASYCGGSVLNQWTVLTAAHCVESDGHDKNFSSYVLAGHEDIMHMPILRVVGAKIAHEDYYLPSVENDIAVLIVDKEIPLGNTVKRVTISDRYPPAGITEAEVAGWGLMNQDDKPIERAIILRYTKQLIIPQAYCAKHGQVWRPGMLCAELENGSNGRTARGDSGGALVAFGYRQIGVVSFRNLKQPNIMYYTNVTHYYNWIVNKMKDSCDPV